MQSMMNFKKTPVQPSAVSRAAADTVSRIVATLTVNGGQHINPFVSMLRMCSLHNISAEDFMKICRRVDATGVQLIQDVPMVELSDVMRSLGELLSAQQLPPMVDRNYVRQLMLSLMLLDRNQPKALVCVKELEKFEAVVASAKEMLESPQRLSFLITQVRGLYCKAQNEGNNKKFDRDPPGASDGILAVASHSVSCVC